MYLRVYERDFLHSVPLRRGHIKCQKTRISCNCKQHYNLNNWIPQRSQYGLPVNLNIVVIVSFLAVSSIVTDKHLRNSSWNVLNNGKCIYKAACLSIALLFWISPGQLHCNKNLHITLLNAISSPLLDIFGWTMIDPCSHSSEFRKYFWCPHHVGVLHGSFSWRAHKPIFLLTCIDY
jgi:hypothetical protein